MGESFLQGFSGGGVWELNPPTPFGGAPGLKPGRGTSPLTPPLKALKLGAIGKPAAPGEPGYRCSLSGLAGFTGIRRTGPNSLKSKL